MATCIGSADSNHLHAIFPANATLQPFSRTIMTKTNSQTHLQMHTRKMNSQTPQTPMLSPEQQSALDAAARGHSIFLTGGAGTGKSFTLKQIIAASRQKYANRPGAVAVVAPTGAAAIQVEGTTIHNWCGMQLIDKLGAERLKTWKHEAWRQVYVLVIDEVSMVADWMLDLLNRMGKETRSSSKPFGGIQVILCGDFLQLPPIVGSFCFHSNAWKETITPDHCFELSYPYRQGADASFASMLSQVRLGKRDDALLEALRQPPSLQDPHDDDHTKIKNTTTTTHGIEPTRLYSKRIDVNSENMDKLNQLPTVAHLFVARDSGPEWAFEPKKAATWTNAAARLTLKVDAQVVLLKNLDIEAGLVNGARGVVTGFSPHSEPVVRFVSGATLTIHPAKWTLSKPDTPNLVQATRLQLPIDLAWALTIHKSQGMSLDLVETDLSECFDFGGMAYVALSRCRTLNGLRIKGLGPTSIKAHPEAIKFHEAIRLQTEQNKERPTKRCKSDSTDK
jgi:ATP-dependent DNA helicase PIF1